MGDADFKCRRCGREVSYDQHRSSRFCPQCGALLNSRCRVRHWVFQFNPEIYRWFDWMKESRATEQWLTSRYAKSIHTGDKVAVWASGKNAGVYALGEVTTDPTKRPLAKEQEEYYTDKEETGKFREKRSVTIRYLMATIERPLLVDYCSKDPELLDMAVLRQPQGTNFRLTPGEWQRMRELVNQNTC